MEKGFSKTVFLSLVGLLAFELLITLVLTIVVTKPIGVIIPGVIVFGILFGILLGCLSDKKYKLDDDFKLTFVRIRKYTLPGGVEDDGTFVEDDEIFVDGEGTEGNILR